MSKTTRLAGTALLASGVALGIISFRWLSRDRAQAEPGVVVGAARAGEVQAREAEELQSIEQRARQAAGIEPLAAAVKMNVDAETMIDLFDNEDWWRAYRADFSFVRLIVDGTVVASRGTVDVGMLDKPIVKLARRQGVASASVSIGNRPYLLAAARLPILPEHPPIIVLGREPIATPPVQPRVTVAPPPPPARPVLPFGLAGVLALAGVGLLVFKRSDPRPEARSTVDAGAAEQPASRFWAPAVPAPRQDEATRPVPVPVPITDTGLSAVPVMDSGAANLPVVVDETGPVAMLGRYRLLGRLGEGGMAELFVAEASGVEGFSRTFVLKKLRSELAGEKDAVAQFVDEARLQASLVHSNIVPVFDFGMAGSQYFMTQEYIIGRDLARLMERHQQHGGRGLPREISFFIAHEILQALAYAHDTRDKNGVPMGIVHRDVSASNVMLSFQGEVKLSDFGIVKSNRRVSKTQVGMVKGNANFMSPEQARGHAVDGRSDLFSLGLMLHYCLTGELMYWGDNDLETLYRAATGPTVEDMAGVLALAEPAASILSRALAVEPADRFQTASEFAEALAVHVGAGKHVTSRLMQQLFADEIRRQTA